MTSSYRYTGSKYPEHDKVALCMGEATSIRSFLEWLSEEQGALLGKQEYGENYAEVVEHELAYTGVEGILARYFDYDLVKLEEERHAMVDEVVQAAQRKEP